MGESLKASDVGGGGIRKPDKIDTANQWYHYSTKLELNIKHLIDQLKDLENKFSKLQDQLDEEIN